MKSKFKDDLSKEKILGKYLDHFYQERYSSSHQSFRRITELKDQLKGIDVIMTINNKQFLIDEKAQLDYLNKSLPTFAFEISFLKNKKIKSGWFFDLKKETDVYFLITNIQTNNSQDLKDGIKDCSITAVHRANLQKMLLEKKLDEKKILEYASKIRQTQKHGKHPIAELDHQNEGFFYYSFNNKNEKPLNLVLYLKFLMKDNQVGKKIK